MQKKTNDMRIICCLVIVVWQFSLVSLIAQQTIPFSENFESGMLDENIWTPILNIEGNNGVVEVVTGSAAYDSQFGVRIGRTTDMAGNITVNALQATFDLLQKENVILDFWINDFRNETLPPNGIFFSDDGGASFVQVWEFDTGAWCNQSYGHHPPLNLSRLAAEYGLELTDQFVIRFQQAGDANFSTNLAQTNDMDGIALDNIQVYELNVDYATLPYQNDFEQAALGTSMRWGDASPTTLPFTDWVKPTARFDIANDEGVEGSFGALLGSHCNNPSNPSAIALDCYLDLLNKQEVILDFWIQDFRDETQPQDGIYFSDNGGGTFIKVWSFDPESWCNQSYGHHPPLNVSKLAAENGLELTSQFVIRFQQTGDADFTTNLAQTEDMDGLALDNIKIYEAGKVYADLPYLNDFESGELGASMAWSADEQTAFPLTELVRPNARFEVANGFGLGESFAAIIGARCDQGAVFSASFLDLFINASSTVYDSVKLSFHFKDFSDESHVYDLIALSVDGGDSFEKIYEFDFEAAPNSSFTKLILDISSLAMEAGLSLSEQTVIRFQQYDNSDFNTNLAQTNDRDGLALDSIAVLGFLTTDVKTLANKQKIEIYPNPFSDQLTLTFDELPSSIINCKIMNAAGELLFKAYAASRTISLNTDQLPPGFYVLLLEQDGNQQAIKLVKN